LLELCSPIGWGETLLQGLCGAYELLVLQLARGAVRAARLAVLVRAGVWCFARRVLGGVREGRGAPSLLF